MQWGSIFILVRWLSIVVCSPGLLVTERSGWLPLPTGFHSFSQDQAYDIRIYFAKVSGEAISR